MFVVFQMLSDGEIILNIAVSVSPWAPSDWSLSNKLRLDILSDSDNVSPRFLWIVRQRFLRWWNHSQIRDWVWYHLPLVPGLIDWKPLMHHCFKFHFNRALSCCFQFRHRAVVSRQRQWHQVLDNHRDSTSIKIPIRPWVKDALERWAFKQSRSRWTLWSHRELEHYGCSWDVIRRVPQRQSRQSVPSRSEIRELFSNFLN